MAEQRNAQQAQMKVKNLPYSEELEKEILGIIMTAADDKVLLNDIFAELDKETFFVQKNKILFSVLKERFNNQENCDMVSLFASITEDVKTKIGGLTYLEEVRSAPISTAIYKSHIEQLTELQRNREIITLASQLSDKATNNEKSAEILNYAGKNLQKITERTIKKDFEALSVGSDRVFNEMFEKYRNGGASIGLETGFANLDEVTNGGFKPGQMLVLAARPGCGKTSFSLEIVANILRSDPDKVIAIFNMEMSYSEIVSKLISSCARVDSKKIGKGSLSKTDLDKISSIKPMFKKNNIYIDESPALTVTEIHSKCRKLKYEKGRLDLIIIDHMQLVAPEKNTRMSRYELMTEISRTIKIIAKDLEVPVLTLSQMSRNVEKTDDESTQQKMPKMSDLRETGAIEQDADAVFFLTPGTFEPKTANSEYEVRPLILLVAKNRSGESDQKLCFDWTPATSEFVVRKNLEDLPVKNAAKKEKKDSEIKNVNIDEEQIVESDSYSLSEDDYNEALSAAPSDYMADLLNSASGEYKEDNSNI